MLKKILLLSFIYVSLCAQGFNTNLSKDWSTGKTRKEVVKTIFEESVEAFNESPLAILNILSDEKIVPKQGTVFALGSGKNFYEWIVPVLNRNDVSVIVIEKPETCLGFATSLRALNYGDIANKPAVVIPILTQKLWEEIKEYNPELITNGKIKTERQLADAIKSQIKFYSAWDFKDRMEEDFGEELKADLIISRLPWTYNLYGELKKDGFAWVVTERDLTVEPADPNALKIKGYDVVDLAKNKVNTLLESDFFGTSKTGRFLAFDIRDSKPYLFFPKELDYKKYAELYLYKDEDVKAVEGEYKSYGNIFTETEGKINFPELPYGGKVLYIIYEDETGVKKVAYSNEVPNLNVNIKDPKAEILVTHRSLYEKILSSENSKGILATGEIVFMPNGEISLFSNRSNTFKGGTANLTFAFDFFKEHGLEFSDKITLDDYSLGLKAKPHIDAVDGARFLIKVSQDPLVGMYYKLILEAQKDAASVVKDSYLPGTFLGETLMSSKSLSDFTKSFWSNIESTLVKGEYIAPYVYNMIGDSKNPNEQILELHKYITQQKALVNEADNSTVNFDSDKIEEIILSSKKPTPSEVTEVLKYAKSLASKGTNVIRLERFTNWLYSIYDELDMDKTPLLPLSKSVTALKTKAEPNVFMLQNKVDYKELSKKLREYLKFDVNNVWVKDYKVDVTNLIPSALLMFVENINSRFAEGPADPREFVTQEECKTFTLVLASMTNEFYSTIDTEVEGKGSKVPAKLLALKDLSEILKVRNSFVSDSYFWSYTRSASLIDEITTKAKGKGFITGGMLDYYEKDFDLKFRSARLKASSKLY